MTTLLLSPRYTEDSIAVRQAALGLGWKVRRLPTWRPTDDLSADDAVAYGEPLFVASVCQFLGLAPMEPPFNWLTTVDTDYTKRAVKFTTLGEARTMQGPLFVKPADDKCFRARVYERPADLPGPSELPQGTPTLCAEPVDWLVEYRTFVFDGVAVTTSPYLRNGSLAKNDEGEWMAPERERQDAVEFVGAVLSTNKLPPGAVIDVGVIRDRGWAVVETNPCWGSGIYGCDPVAVCNVIRSATKRLAEVSLADRQWLPVRGGIAIE